MKTVKEPRAKTTKSKRAPKSTVPKSAAPKAADALQAILTERFKPAFNAMPRDILEATSQQFCDRLLVYREWAQNSQDANARQIQCVFQMEDVVAGGFTFVATWVDNGTGMSRSVVENAYLRIFSSTKEETRHETIGYFSLGRLIVFAFVPDLIVQETLTLPEASEERATLIRLFPDGTGEVYDLERDEASAGLGPAVLKHGTQITLKHRMSGGEAEFAAEVEKSMVSIRKECRWIRPRLTVTTVRYEAAATEDQPGTLVWGSEVINKPFGTPGRLSKSYPFQLSSGLGQGVVSIGVRPDDKDPMPDLTNLTLTAGGIPLERSCGFPWRNGQEEFYFANLRIIIESFQWRPPIGRHRVKRDEPFFQEIVPKVFSEIILGRYVPWLSAKLKDPRERRSLFGYHRNTDTMFYDLLNEAARRSFEIPACVLELPLFRQYGSWRGNTYSVQELDAAKHFYYTTHKPELADYRDSFDRSQSRESEGGSIVLDLYGTLYATTFIESRYASKAERVNDHFFVEEELSETGKALRVQLTALVHDYINYPCRIVNAARFIKLGEGQVPETGARAQAQKERRRIVINLNNPDIARMSELALRGGSKEERFLGAHFLLREILLADGLEMSEGNRQKALQTHCAQQNTPPESSREQLLNPRDRAERLKALRQMIGGRAESLELFENEVLALLGVAEEESSVVAEIATL